jgi:hypothetical protein
MALSYDQITAITQTKLLPKLVDNLFNSNVLLKRLKAKEMPVDGGDKILQPLEYASTSASGWFQGAETLDTTDNEILTSAEFDWRQLYANISVTRRDELRNKGDAAILNFVKSKMQNAEKTIRDKLSTGLYNTGSSSKQIQGLRLMLSTSSTVGGISQTDYSWWASNVDSTTTTLTLAAMQSAFGDAGEGTEYPNLVIGDQDMFDRYYNLLTPMQRFASEDEAKGGFKSLLFNGVPVVVDASCPSGDMMFLNLDYIHLRPHKDENFRMTSFVSPINQAVNTAKVFWMGALTYSNNRRHALLDAITA